MGPTLGAIAMDTFDGRTIVAVYRQYNRYMAHEF